MDWIHPPSGGHGSLWELNHTAPVILRLLPWVHHPPSEVLLLRAGEEANALYARGYRVTVADILNQAPEGSFDLLCEHGSFAMLPPAERPRYVAAAARALRPGGQLFGSFLERADDPNQAAPYGTTASEVLRMFADHFDVHTLSPSAFAVPLAGYTQLEAILIRR